MAGVRSLALLILFVGASVGQPHPYETLHRPIHSPHYGQYFVTAPTRWISSASDLVPQHTRAPTFPLNYRFQSQYRLKATATPRVFPGQYFVQAGGGPQFDPAAHLHSPSNVPFYLTAALPKERKAFPILTQRHQQVGAVQHSPQRYRSDPANEKAETISTSPPPTEIPTPSPSVARFYLTPSSSPRTTTTTQSTNNSLELQSKHSRTGNLWENNKFEQRLRNYLNGASLNRSIDNDRPPSSTPTSVSAAAVDGDDDDDIIGPFGRLIAKMLRAFFTSSTARSTSD